ncbi:MAG: DUF262 domain-containing protein [Deltaproteobacteria bacterium]|nr:DUF262 domain-containing protein [Deltaproteobacteria bacterium]
MAVRRKGGEMGDPQDQFEVQPEIVFIFELLARARKGELRVPRFQRRFVWRRDQMLDLLDSVWRRYPIGSFLVWSTHEDLETIERLGPVRVGPGRPNASGDGSGRKKAYVLDGHQRLSTLVGTLLARNKNGAPSTDEDDDDPGRWTVWFDLDEQIFYHPKEEHVRAGASASAFPISSLIETFTFLEECKRIDRDSQLDGPRSAERVERAQQLLRAFQTYKLPVIRVEDTDLDQAVAIFARLNSMGQRMTADQLVSAITFAGSAELDLAARISDMQQELAVHGFRDVGRTILLRAVLACAGQDIYRNDWIKARTPQGRPDSGRKTDDGSRQRRELSQQVAEAVEPAAKALIRAVEFLQSVGVKNERLLPYQMQLVALAAFFSKRCQPTAEQRRILERWFWVSSFAGWFASGNPSRVKKLIDEFRTSFAENDTPQGIEAMDLDEPGQPFPSYFDMRSARVRTLLHVLLGLAPRDDRGQPLDDAARLLAEHGPAALGHVVSGVPKREGGSSPANRVFVAVPGERSKGSDWLVGLDDAARRLVLESHYISEQAWEALRQGDRPGFIRLREQALIECELRFMQAKNVREPRVRQPQPSAIDAGGDE